MYKNKILMMICQSVGDAWSHGLGVSLFHSGIMEDDDDAG